MKTIYTFLIVLAVPVVLLFVSFTAGPPGGYTGSPLDGITCVDCHFPGPANPADGWITTNIPVDGYMPGMKYTVTATGTDVNANKFGFQITAEDGKGKSGTFVLTDPDNTKFSAEGNAWVTHTAAGTGVVGMGASWSMDWIAPEEGTGPVTFYASFNAANGDNTNNGDVIYTSMTTVIEFHVGIDENALAEQVSLYPNPATSYLNVDLPGISQIRIFDVSGRLIQDVESADQTLRVNVASMEKGIYVAQISHEGVTTSKRFMVR